MSKAKWFAVRKPSTGEIIATSANQIALHYIHQTPFPLTVLKGGGGGSGDKTSCQVELPDSYNCQVLSHA